jgi:hypothetical protein
MKKINKNADVDTTTLLLYGVPLEQLLLGGGGFGFRK